MHKITICRETWCSGTLTEQRSDILKLLKQISCLVSYKVKIIKKDFDVAFRRMGIEESSLNKSTVSKSSIEKKVMSYFTDGDVYS